MTPQEAKNATDYELVKQLRNVAVELQRRGLTQMPNKLSPRLLLWLQRPSRAISVNALKWAALKN